MAQLLKMVNRVAASNATVLIQGESGTGKELIAKEIHEKSNRAKKPFVAINCGALRETLLESELFGHEKGAFTGAYTRKVGLVEVAHGGTLFLDEIGELTPGIQAKLLRFLQEGEFYRVGGDKPLKVDVRILSATNRSLDQEVVKGNFREDLYYRVNTIQLYVPALRQRREDIMSLLDHFIKDQRDFETEAFNILMKYDWPGNVRELQNTCERLLVLTDKVITKSDLPQSILEPRPNFEDAYDPGITLHELEKRYIQKALDYYKGNKTQAAAALGIGIKTLYNRLHEYGMTGD
jgi:two-component system response regulator HydG